MLCSSSGRFSINMIKFVNHSKSHTSIVAVHKLIEPCTSVSQCLHSLNDVMFDLICMLYGEIYTVYWLDR